MKTIMQLLMAVDWCTATCGAHNRPCVILNAHTTHKCGDC